MIMNGAERIIKANGCVVQMHVGKKGQELFYLKKQSAEVSPRFHSLFSLCRWTMSNHDEIFRRIELGTDR